MNQSNKSVQISYCKGANFARYSLTLLLSAVLLSDSVGATPRRTLLQIAQQAQSNPQQATGAAAQRVFQEGVQLYKQGTAKSLQKAIEKWEEALKLFRAVDDKAGETLTLVGIGRVYSNLGEKQKALEFFNQALPLIRAVDDRAREAATLNNIGEVYDNLGEKQKALDFFNQALPLLRAVNNRAREAATLNNIGAVYNDLGEKQKALDFYNQALPLSRAVEDRRGEALTLSNIGIVYNALGEKQKALDFFNQALPLLRAVKHRAGEALMLNNIGGVYDALGEKQKALDFYNQALLLSRAAEDKTGQARTLNNIGGVYSDLGEKQKALDFYNQALHLRRAVKHRTGEATTLNNIGVVYSDLGEKQKALSFYNQALPLTRAVGDRAGEANTLFNIAYLERNRGNFNAAITQIEAAIKIIEDLRTKVVSPELRSSYFASVQGYYKFYIDLLMQLHKQNPSKGYNALALNASERSRARGLIELLTEANADIRKGVSPKLLAEEERLQQLIDARAKLLEDLADTEQTQATAALLKKELESLLNQQQELQTQIRTRSPQYANLKYPQPLKLPQIQQQLDQDTLLLQYSLGKERSYVWAVTPNSIDSYELPGREQIEEVANYLKKSLHNPTSLPGTTKAATFLSKLILAPVADKLGQKRLVIVADGALQYIPFAALTQPKAILNLNRTTPPLTPPPTPKSKRGGVPKGGWGRDYQPLLINHEIVNLPSVTAIATHRQDLKGRKVAPKTLAILADPVFSTDDERVTGKPKNNIVPDLNLPGQLEQSALQRAAKNLNRRDWARLEGTRFEAEAILKLVSPSNRLQVFDFDANYNWATNKQLTQYRFVHFATHGFADSTNPELSGIILSLVDKAGKPMRGYLRLGDIFNLNITAELVVLSACETGLGKNVNGEGLVGLTRGLMYAGTKRAVVSLWNVDDEGTSKLMTLFYKEMLQQSLSPAAALRAAQLKMWQQENWRNPNYWAAFTLQGEWR